MKPHLKRIHVIGLALACGSLVSLAEEKAPAPRIGDAEHHQVKPAPEQKATPVDEVKIKRTTVFDEAEIKKLYKDAKARNDAMSEGLPAHINAEELELYTLKTLNVEGVDIRMQRDLVERIEPRPRRRLQRIADVDPDAAREMMVTARNDHEFMAGAYDRQGIAGDPGRSADFSHTQLVGVLDKGISALQNALGGKKRSKEDEEE